MSEQWQSAIVRRVQLKRRTTNLIERKRLYAAKLTHWLQNPGSPIFLNCLILEATDQLDYVGRFETERVRDELTIGFKQLSRLV